MAGTIETDALIVGAGPCGLFQVFELGLLGIRAHVVDSMPVVGGQCAELYPDKPIYDIPGIPECTAMELVENLMVQIKPFHATFHLGEEVTELQGPEGGPFRLATSGGKEFLARTVFIAAGVGSFQPRQLRVEGVQTYVDRQIFYRVTDPSRFDDQDVVILGGGDSALDWTLALADRVRSLVLVHRRDEYRAAPASVERMLALCAEGKMRALQGLVQRLVEQDGKLTGIQIQGPAGEEQVLPLQALLVFYGLAPKLGPIADWGLEINRKTVRVDTEKFQTNIPGIFAIGDVNDYPGKKKLILSGFHEAALAAFAAKHLLEPDKKVHLQYTTTSPLMHERLGLKD